LYLACFPSIERSLKPIQEVYTFAEQLGKPGAFGKAWRVIKKSTKEQFACKVGVSGCLYLTMSEGMFPLLGDLQA